MKVTISIDNFQVIWDISDKVRPGVKNVVDDIRDRVSVCKS